MWPFSAAGDAAAFAASSAAVAEVLQIHEGKLETMSKNVKQVSQTLDSKLTNLEKAVNKAASEPKMIKVADDQNLPVQGLSELTRAVDNQVRVLDRGFNHLQV